ncbi:hypothetical protein ACVOMS_11230 [Bradyrhizobium guangxiense]
MRRTVSLTLIVAIGCLFGAASGASAQCTVPNQITNGQVADANQVMANFNAVLNCLANPTPIPSIPLSGPSGGIISLQNLGATTNYNFNLPATPGNAGDVLTSGGSANSQTWTPTGTSGHVLPFLNGNNTWSGTQTFGPVVGLVSTQSGTVYILAATDCGTTILFSSNTTVTVTTLNSLPAGCAIAIEQGGTGQIVIAAGAGATQHSAHGYTKTYGQYAILGLFVDSNAGGSAANVIITGDGA